MFFKGLKNKVLILVLFLSILNFHSFGQFNDNNKEELKKEYLRHIQNTDQFDQYQASNEYKNLIKNETNKKEYIKALPSTELKPKENSVESKEISENLLKTEIPSSIEQMFSQNFEGISIKQFGYDFFKRKVVSEYLPVGDNYTVGPGDTIAVYLWGDPVDILGLEGFYTLTIDREGKIYIPSIGVFYVWGLTVSKVKETIKKALSKKFKKFELEVTLGKLREFPVYVSGFVNQPGTVLATGVNSVLDVLTLAGGVSKTGSLRDIVLRRLTEDGIKEIHIDMYDLLVHGKPVDTRIKEGDTILVKPIGKVVGVSGVLKRPAIYEIREEESLKDVINLAGGTLPSVNKYNVKIIRYENNQIKMKEGTLNKDFIDSIHLKDGDLVKIEPIISLITNKVTIEGYVKYPGDYSLKENSSLRKLLKKAEIFVDTNIYYGELERKEPGKKTQYLTFIPKDILQGKTDIHLKAYDRIKLYKFGDVESVDFNKFQESFILKGHIKYPGVYTWKPGITLSQILNSQDLLIDTNVYYGEIVRKKLPDLKYEIINFSPIDIINKKTDIKIQKMDSITFYPKWLYKPIQINGEVKHPTIIPYYEGITLIDAIRSVGLKDEPRYLKVSIFREEQNKEEKNNSFGNRQNEESKNLLSKKTDLQKQFNLKEKTNGNLQNEENNIDQENIESIKENIQEKQHKIVYLYDLLIKGEKSVNLKLEPGDKLLIQRVEPTEKDKTVTILGEVKKPGIYKYKNGMKLYDLIKIAGGYTEDAYPRGLIFIRESAKKLQQEQLNISILSMEETLTKSQESYSTVASSSPEQQALIRITLNKQKQLLEILKKKAKLGLGRIALDIPNTLEELKKSQENIELTDGDYIYVPSKPNYILVLGDVYNQISLPYRKGKTVEYYLSQVGGLGKNANEDYMYIIKANGRVISKQQSSSIFKNINWKDNKLYFGGDFYSMKLEQGDTIVVPSEIKVPVLWMPLIKDVTQIIFQALSTAVLAKRL